MRTLLRLAGAAVFAALPAHPAAAQAPGDRLTLRDYLDLEDVQDPRLSPDGRQVLFTRRAIDQINDRWESSLWLVNADGSKLRSLVRGGGARWSPDGSRIAYGGFASDWEIYTINPDGTGRTRLTFAHKVFDAQPSWR